MVFDTIINTNVFKNICRYAFFFTNLRVRTGRKSGRKIRKEIGRKYQFIDSVKYFSHARRKIFLHYQKL